MALPDTLRERIPALVVDSPDSPKTQGTPAPQVSERSARACREATRLHAKTFYFASRFLRKRQRGHAYAVYAYCRYVDDLIDEPEDPQVTPSADALFEENKRFLQGTHPAPFTEAFARTCEERRIPAVLLDELVRGCCRDRGRVRIANRNALWEYCYLVASVVGLMMSRVFGIARSEAYEKAVEMGLAMQLTNILRDIAEDYEKDRIYLPADELGARELSVGELIRSGPSKEWKEYLRDLIATTRELYRSAEEGLPDIVDPRGRKTARIMGRVYGGILEEIERSDYDVRQRHFVSLPRKIRLALKR